jgi:glycine/sarcosine/betaine reductase complex component A
MDLEEQGTIQRLVEGGDRDRMVVLLGTPTAGSTMMIALTLTQGDPSYAGPLAGVPLGLPVYHVLEDEVKAAVPEEVYDREIGPMALVLDAPAIVSALAMARTESGAPWRDRGQARHPCPDCGDRRV